ncbi:amino acid adenylation domain-containing protein [Streptomyces sp. NPDC056149]|uniref:non-ribosomal peptide synthetase n=1 Tax=Streptomyces sp. NPDC056149 TaxID=3345728 RepID=UPI0035DE7BE6
MKKLTDEDRAYWERALAVGGFTAVPRWSRHPVTGLATHELTLPDETAEALTRQAAALGATAEAVLLAAHAKVLAALSGEAEVTTGYRPAEGGPALPCRVSTAGHSWRGLVTESTRATEGLLAHRGVRVTDLRNELGLEHDLFEVEWDLSGGGEELAESTVLRVAPVRCGERMVLRLRYRTEVLDAESVARIGGYHLAALAQFVADPEAAPVQHALLSVAERRVQLEGLAGPCRVLPDRRFHELFEERVRVEPGAVAVVWGEEWLSYGELNGWANRLGRALVAQGLGREGVVGVVAERSVEWLAAVLAVFKAGGVYLPIEPHFPAERMAAMLRRAGCGLVLVEAGSSGALDEALAMVSGVRRLCVGEVLAEGGFGGEDLGVEVGADQLAYVYFTSGSTGEPKGALCEHAGFLNHLFAKIDDLGMGAGSVVAQTAPQCFDISLWQLVSALVVGGRTLLVGQETVLDVGRFVEELARGRVSVVQVVPSYLEAVVSHLELHPRALPDLRCVSVTGEALKRELVQRWFAVNPGIRLMNAYGLTETSDDTHHEVMVAVPRGERVPLGRCVNNVRAYVVDEDVEPVPLGAPGQIVFSGVCVGRGYVNDPERTRVAFREDPHRVGERLYVGGDFGRWLPGGKLEFLGRRDAQVKVRGFRIEIGEVENALSRVVGVRDGAVVVAGGEGQGKRLVAFYSGPQPLEDEALRVQLGDSLPSYMVPTTFQWLERLPLTANGKIDGKALTALANASEAPEEGQDAPHTPTERRLARAWAEVLGVPEDQIGRRDHFFGRGGTSLSALKLVIALDRAVSLRELTTHPVLADLAELLDGHRKQGEDDEGEDGGGGGLLQTLVEPVGEPVGHLVCFPFAGGGAVAFQAMAEVLRAGGFAVHAVALSGHEPADDQAPFAPLEEVVRQTADEIARRGLAGVVLWGHAAGAAYAWATAQLLQEEQVHVQRVFLGAQLLGDAAERRAAAEALLARSDAEIVKELTADNDPLALGALDARRAERVGAAYRHDGVAAHRYFADALEHPPTTRLTAPVTLVLADDDPFTVEGSHRLDDWRLLADHVELCRLPDGGHYFPRTRPADAARAVLRTDTS